MVEQEKRKFALVLLLYLKLKVIATVHQKCLVKMERGFQAHLGNAVGLVSDHHKRVNIIVKQVI